MPSPVPTLNVSLKAVAPASRYKHLQEQQEKVSENIVHSSCTRNGDHFGLLIKTGSTQKKRMMSKLSFVLFEAAQG